MWAISCAITASSCCGLSPNTVAGGSKTTGRSHPTTLGPSAIEDINTRIGRPTPIRSARLVTMSRMGFSAGSPRRFSEYTCLPAQTMRSENRITPIDQIVGIHDLAHLAHLAHAYQDGRISVCTSRISDVRSEEHTSELQSLRHLVCRL